MVIKAGIVRYASLASAIARAIGGERPPDVRLGQARAMLVFRSLGATRWPEAKQIEHALRAASVARTVIAADARRGVRQRAARAIEVVYEDATLVRGCAVTARWECVVPAADDRGA